MNKLFYFIVIVTDAFGMENIFEQMQKYKEEADQLTGDERKRFAEKVILSLWKNIGDEEDESDDDDDNDNNDGDQNQK
ncbi:unnamed protein product [Rotaria sp. Silwood2]|nr:unnamed protein product [Rotaria sp. Silwood2]CAF2574223.1 unnamed protein product [Rotaria sp. Silwood2]CAF2735487.1 unnamed protein product [Rotaria sp. Silwood2]CAF3877586.1 unnamed protein product [Rotaria sp. Silwood2]CAF3988964.1 unnamed protein product [Rotaria sp. Silwood2]